MHGITVTHHNKMEWARMAQDAYTHGVNWLGHRMSGAAALRSDMMLREDAYDTLQRLYRQWLLDGIGSFDNPQ